MKTVTFNGIELKSDADTTKALDLAMTKGNIGELVTRPKDANGITLSTEPIILISIMANTCARYGLKKRHITALLVSSSSDSLDFLDKLLLVLGYWTNSEILKAVTSDHLIAAGEKIVSLNGMMPQYKNAPAQIAGAIKGQPDLYNAFAPTVTEMAAQYLARVNAGKADKDHACCYEDLRTAVVGCDALRVAFDKGSMKPHLPGPVQATVRRSGPKP